MHEKLAEDFTVMSNLPKTFREWLETEYEYVTLEIVEVQRSKLDGTCKYLFRLPDGHVIESVLMRYHHGNSVCISSQAGCRMGCRFCASTIGGLERNLKPSEMLEQIYRIQCDSGERVSTVVICGLLVNFSAKDGLFNIIMEFFGHQRSDLLMSNAAFLPIYLASNVWTSFGWDSIIYFSALAGVDQEQYEAAYVDGAGRFKRMLHITLPGIMPVIVIQLILKIGGLMSVGSEKILLLYSPITYETADVISTFVYRKGMLDYDYSYSTAVELFNSVINIALLVMANKLSRKVNETSLW